MSRPARGPFEPGEPVHVLVIDDSALQRAALAAMLEAGGFTYVHAAASAAEAFELLRTMPPSGIVVILTDLHMPGIDGIEACRTIKAMPGWFDVPIILVTTSGGEPNLERAFTAGAMDFITKPPRELELVARVRSAARLKRETDRRKAREAELHQLNLRLEQRAAELAEARAALLDLNLHLENRVRAQVEEIVRRASEVELLNAQLRVQVQERSRELARALRGLSGEPVRTPGPGTEIGGRVRVVRSLAEGGMSEIYLAEDLQTGLPVAVKLLRTGIPAEPSTLQRFIGEAEAAAAVAHPAIVKTLHVDVTADGHLYLVMEYVMGVTLARQLASGPLGVGASVRIGAVVAEALAAAHASGVIHRDIKPDNLILSRAHPGVRVLDFGIAKIRQEEQQTSMTRSHWLLGTPRYMSPEQIRNPASVTAATDIYSLGGVLFETIAGEPPFAGHDTAALLVAHVTEPARDVRELVSTVPDDLARLVARCLQKDAKARPAATDLAEELSRLARAFSAPPADEILPTGLALAGGALAV